MCDSLPIILEPLNEPEKTDSAGPAFTREREARIRAEYANRQKDELLLVIAHELRNPLNSIAGWIELLDSEKLTEPMNRRAIQAIRRSAKLQRKIIEDLLDGNGKMRLDLAEIEIAPLFDNALLDTRLLAEAKKIELDCRIPANLGCLKADFHRLEQVLWNLITNAVKFTPEGGRIRVIFEPFRQAENNGTREGLGLGLAIVYRIIELHGGSIRADSAGGGKGSVFTVWLPASSL
jgi:signal transduction histidine kinase